jgi:Zn-dependent protease with chaperone function
MTTILDLFSGGSILFAAIPGSFSWRLRFQKDDRILSIEKRICIESKIQELAQKLEISKSIELIEKKGKFAGLQAQGIELFYGRAGIAIDPELVKVISEEQLEFLLAHELAHIKANDHLWMCVASSIVGIITTLAMNILFQLLGVYFSPNVSRLLGISPAAAIGLSISHIALAFFSKWREECADKLGISICSDAAQTAAPTFFDSLKTFYIECRNSEEDPYLFRLLVRFLITSDGDVRFDIYHPSLKTRINYLQFNNGQNRIIT